MVPAWRSHHAARAIHSFLTMCCRPAGQCAAAARRRHVHQRPRPHRRRKRPRRSGGSDRRDKIIAVGSNADIERAAGPNTRRIDLRGRALTPGLIDAHDHFSSAARIDSSSRPELSRTSKASPTSPRRFARRSRRRQRGRGFRDADGTKASSPNAASSPRRISTQPSPDNPVFLTQTTGHYGVANTAALRLGNVTRDTRDTPGGTIDRNPDGTPTGVLKEGAMGLVRRNIPGEPPPRPKRVFEIS